MPRYAPPATDCAQNQAQVSTVSRRNCLHSSMPLNRYPEPKPLSPHQQSGHCAHRALHEYAPRQICGHLPVSATGIPRSACRFCTERAAIEALKSSPENPKPHISKKQNGMAPLKPFSKLGADNPGDTIRADRENTAQPVSHTANQ